MNDNGTLQMPPQASTIASEVDALYYFIFWGSVFFFVLITGLSLLFIFKYRRREGETMTRREDHNTPLELAWSIIPLAILILVFVWGFKGYMSLAVAPGNSLEYHVTGKRWLWEITHPNGEVMVNEMTVPMNQPIKVILTSEDVLHSFFVPDFRVKQDAVPNRYHTLWFEAILPGEFNLYCTEYCGTGHSTMLAKVKVLPEAEYEVWLEAQEDDPSIPLEVLGEKLYTSKACVTCHSIDGSKKTGPSFQGIYNHPAELTDGTTVIVDENYIRQSILEPNSQVVAGFEPVMPTYSGTLKPRQIDALIEFIKTLE